ncbi:hypothetical protein BOO86_03080 [Mycobacterium sp. CBMA 234]|nr:hypothetical protein [Mycolicibacterium sp. CBMA 234]
MSTWTQKSLTDAPGETFTTRGTTPAAMPGNVFDSGVIRRLTGKSSTTSLPSPPLPRVNSAHAAVMTDVRGMFHT